MNYIAQKILKPQRLVGISNKQINDHWKLYEGYVHQVNIIQKELEQLRNEKQGNSFLYADRRRRLGFEYNGMVLHEYYFGNLKSGQKEPSCGALFETLSKMFGSFPAWKHDFITLGKTRGIGWGILLYDPASGNLTNHFITEHENGHIASFIPILVMDVWEHAYMVDRTADGRSTYIEEFMKNINWEKVEKRFTTAKQNMILKRF